MFWHVSWNLLTKLLESSGCGYTEGIQFTTLLFPLDEHVWCYIVFLQDQITLHEIMIVQIHIENFLTISQQIVFHVHKVWNIVSQKFNVLGHARAQLYRFFLCLFWLVWAANCCFLDLIEAGGSIFHLSPETASCLCWHLWQKWHPSKFGYIL